MVKSTKLSKKHQYANKENTEIYHFELTQEDMDKINNLDRNEKHDWY